MTFYFSWVDEGAVFDPLVHGRQDLSIFSFEITAKEGLVPWMRLRVENPRQGLASFERQWGILSWQKGEGEIEPLFCGQLLCIGQQVEGESLELSFCAASSQNHARLQSLVGELQKGPLWHPAFVQAGVPVSPSELLESRTALLYWDRCTPTIEISDLFYGRKGIDIGGDFFADTLNVRLKELPLSAVRVCLKSSWVQSYEGVSDLTTLIRSRFPGGMVNTLTGDNLVSKWWKTGEKVGKSGYWVEYSDLKEVSPLRTGPLDLYPSYSSKIWISPHDPMSKDPVPKQVRLKRKWYKMKLLLGWRYKQKRTENVHFTLSHKTQKLGAGDGKIRTLTIPVYGLSYAHIQDKWTPGVRYSAGFRLTHEGNVYECARRHRARAIFDGPEQQDWVQIGVQPQDGEAPQSSFFTRPDGHIVIAHALEIAKAHLAASCRAVEITFTTRLSALSGISCDHHIHLSDERLPGGRATGKVTSYRLSGDGARGIFRADVTLGCGVGSKHQERPTIESDQMHECASQLETGLWRTPSGLTFQSVAQQPPHLGIVNPEGLSAIDLVEDVHVEGLPHVQNEHLVLNQYPVRHSLNSVLGEVKTEIALRLKDLRARPNLVHDIHVTQISPWEGPRQIDLSASKAQER